MSAGQSNEYALQVSIELGKAIAELKEAYGALHKLEEPIETDVKVKVNLADAEQRIASLSGKLTATNQKLAEMTAQTRALNAALDEAAKLIETVLPGASKTLMQGAAASRNAISSIQEGLAELDVNQAKLAAGAIGEITRLRRIKEQASKEASEEVRKAIAEQKELNATLKAVEKASTKAAAAGTAATRAPKESTLAMATASAAAAARFNDPAVTSAYLQQRGYGAQLSNLGSRDGGAALRELRETLHRDMLTMRATGDIAGAAEARAARLGLTDLARSRRGALPAAASSSVEDGERQKLTEDDRLFRRYTMANLQEEHRLTQERARIAAQNERAGQQATMARMRAEEMEAAKEEVRTAQYWMARLKNDDQLKTVAQREQAAYWMARMRFADREMSEEERESAQYHTRRMRHEEMLTGKELAAYKENDTIEKKILRAKEDAVKKANEENARYQLAKMRFDQQSGGQGGSTSGFGTTIRNMLASMGGFGAGFLVANGIRNQVHQALAYEQSLATLQGALPGQSANGRDLIAGGIGRSAVKYGQDLSETAAAAKEFVTSGMTATEVVRALDNALAASKGMGMTINQAADLVVAMRSATAESANFSKEIDYGAASLDKIARVSMNYAVSATAIGTSLKLVLPILDEFGKGISGMETAMDYGAAITAVMIKTTRVSGEQAAQAQKQLFSRLSNPGTLQKLQQGFKLNLGTADGKDFLPLDQMIAQLGRTYERLQASSPARAKEFASQLGGGRNLHEVIALLANYKQVSDIAEQSAFAFGDAQARAAVATDTLANATQRIGNSFTLFTKNLYDTSGAATGLKVILNGLADIMMGFNGTGAGMGTMAALLLGGGAVVQGIKASYGALSLLAEGAGVAGASVGGLSSVVGGLAAAFGTGTLVVAGLLGTVALLGYAFDASSEKAGRYAVKIKSLEDQKVWDAPQMKELGERATRLGFGTGYAATSAAQNALVHPSQKMASVEAEIERIHNMPGVERAAYEASNPQGLNNLKKEWTKLFIETLPQAAKDGFGQIKNEQERVAEAVSLLGNAAWSANVHMMQALDGLRQKTNEMVDDALKGMNLIDTKARDSKMQTALANIGLAWKGVATSDDKFTVHGGATSRAEEIANAFHAHQKTVGDADFRAQMMTTLETANPLIASFLKKDKGADAIFGSTVAGMANGREFTTADFLAKLLGNIRAMPNVAERLGAVAGLEAGPEFLGATHRLNANAAGVGRIQTLAEKNAEGFTDLVKGGTAALMQAAKTDLESQNKDGVTVRTGYEAHRDGSNGSVLPLGTNDGIVTFKTLLLDAAKQAYDAFHKFNEQAAEAKNFGLAFDKGGAMVALARQLDGKKLGELEFGMNYDIVKLYKQHDELKTIPRVDENGVKTTAYASAEAKYLEQIADIRKQMKEGKETGLDQIFGVNNSARPEIAKVKKEFKDALILGGAGAATTLEELFSKLPDIIRGRGFEMTAEMNQRVQDASLLLSITEKQNALQLAEIPMTASLATILETHAAAAENTYLAQRHSLDVQHELHDGQRKMGDDEYKLAVQKLDAEYQITSLYEARMALSKAGGELDKQTFTNIQSALSGVKRLAMDQSIWEGVVFPSAATAALRWRQSAMAIRKVLFDTITPVFKTMSDRLLENVYQSVSEAAFDSAKLGGLAASPESKMKRNVVEAQAAADRFGDVGGIVANNIGSQFFQAGTQVAQMIATAVRTGTFVPGSIVGGATPGSATAPFDSSGFPTLPTDTTASQGFLKDHAAALQGAGLLVGQVGGTLLGKGGQLAQQGSAIGAGIGALAGNVLAPGIGGIVGSSIGGLLGGFLGGKKDLHQRDPVDPIIKGLDAIERAQKETITTINAQTDALLKPESRFLNLPSGFNTPAYNPGFGPSAGGGGISVGSIQINVPVQTNASPNEIQNAVEKAVTNVLSGQRSGTGWNKTF